MSISDKITTTPQIPVQFTPQRIETPRGATAGSRVLAVLRIALGLTFLWAFADKLFGWGYATSSGQAWLNGGSPTQGFLAHVEVGPLHSMLQAWAGSPWADWLFMLGLLGLGLALTLGVALRLSAVAGTLLLAMMWIAEWPLARHTLSGAATSSSNPLIDYHVIYAIGLILVAVTAAGATWGLGRRWAGLDLVRRNPWLR
jgi:thiosulfate dehydrogenase [quinone] large subunit